MLAPLDMISAGKLLFRLPDKVAMMESELAIEPVNTNNRLYVSVIKLLNFNRRGDPFVEVNVCVIFSNLL